MLKGAELLAKVKELAGNATKSEMVRECGYASLKRDGTERLSFSAFYDALLEAKGFELEKSPKRGRSLAHKTKVLFNGSLQVGAGYLREMGYAPGAEFDIKLRGNSITLTAV